MKKLYEVLVPTIYGDTLKPIRTRHHKEWDKLVMKITGGLTILSPGKGKWVFENTTYPEKVIPVRIMCDEAQFKAIIKLTLNHYRQKAVMAYKITDEVNVYTKEDFR